MVLHINIVNTINIMNTLSKVVIMYLLVMIPGLSCIICSFLLVGLSGDGSLGIHHLVVFFLGSLFVMLKVVK
jgi:hypothetical protein